MTENLRTLVAMVVDRSGSMSSICDATIEGINSFLTEQKADPENVKFTYVQFDDKYETVYDNIPISDAPLITHETFVPRGMTALLDAIGKTINTMSTFIATQILAERPEKVVLVIVTDGYENASRQFNHAAIQELIKSKQDGEGWQIVYLGANQNAINQATSYGIRGTTAMNYSAGVKGTRGAYAAVSANVESFKKGAPVMEFTREQRLVATSDSAEEQRRAVSEWTAAGVNVPTQTQTGQAPDAGVSSGQTGAGSNS